MKVEAYCACGGALKGTISGKDEAKARKTLNLFRQVHNMEGCKPCDSETARKVRRQKKDKA